MLNIPKAALTKAPSRFLPSARIAISAVAMLSKYLNFINIICTYG
jgi:hypothetical protein